MKRDVYVIDPPATDHDTLTVANSAVSTLTANKANIAKAVFITVEDNPIRYWIDGTEPTANEGHRVLANQSIYFNGPSRGCNSITQLKMIATGNNATLQVTYY